MASKWTSVDGGWQGVSAVVGARTRAVRQQNGWAQTVLIERLAGLGVAWKVQSLSQLEIGKRGVSVDELLLLAMALDVAPASLLVPVDDKDSVWLAEVEVSAADLRGWVLGRGALPGGDEDAYRSSLPKPTHGLVDDAHQARESLVEQIRRAERVVADLDKRIAVLFDVEEGE